MANVKNIEITGVLPFDCVEDESFARYLAQLNAPAIGVRIAWTNMDTSVPNSHGGQTALYKFRVRGQEALSYGWLDAFREAVVGAGGSIKEDHVTDLEA